MQNSPCISQCDVKFQIHKKYTRIIERDKENLSPMRKTLKVIAASILAAVFTGCAVPELKLPEIPEDLQSLLKPRERIEYTGADTVGDFDSNMLIGSWQVKSLSGDVYDEFDLKMTFNSDQTLIGKLKANFEQSLGKFEYDIIGTWSVDDGYVTISPTSATETSGNPMAGSADTLFEEESIANVYEASADYLVIVDEEDGYAQSFTRL